MSVIFQTEPPSILIHKLPKNSNFISYSVDDALTISVWMPDQAYTIEQKTEYSYDDFYHSWCDGCERNCHSFLANVTDEDGEIDWSQVHGGESNHCDVYDNGYNGQHCPEGNVMEDEEVYFDVADMVFSASLNYMGEPPRYKAQSDSAYLCAGSVVDGKVYATYTLAASNVFGNSTFPEGICWGYNNRPDNLREIATEYFSTPFNNDLTNIHAFSENCDRIRQIKTDVANYNFKANHHYLCHGGEADALLLVDAEQNVPAFFTLLSAGFTNLPEIPHLMIVPIKEVEFERDGVTFNGFETIPDGVGKKWFVTNNGLLVGQI
jgi:hypothetical protein